MKPYPLVFLAAAACLSVTASPTTIGGRWFEFRPTNENGPSVIGLEDWLPRPAGRFGPVLMFGDQLVFRDGGEAKFWGVNLGGSDCVPTREMAVFWAERFARYGINAVRFHKPWSDMYTQEDSTQLREDALERFDFFCNELRKRGIYYGWSFFYHRRLGERDLERLRWPEELLAGKNGQIYGTVDYIPEIQDILIEATINLLNHTNPHTGLRYADDPALMSVEFQNESSIMFMRYSMPSLPNYQRDLARRFSLWLREKYGSHDGLIAAWGPDALNAYEYQGEHLDEENIFARTVPEEFGTRELDELEARGLRQRTLDNAAFFHDLQNDFYLRFLQKVRRTGYLGPVVGSCWRGKADIGEYYNLRSDALVGIIDRHNYHGGLRGWRPRAEPFASAAQVNEPGGGLFSSGMVQVVDRPFAISEWSTVFPNEWVLESPSIVAAYGLGLQGWDASYQFATNTKTSGFGDTVHGSNLLWQVERPENMGVYPALARMIHRRDIVEGEIVSVRRVQNSHLLTGDLPWGSESYTGGHEVKMYQGPIPGAALAAGRVVVEFSDDPRPSLLPGEDELVQDGVIRANNGQLVWDISRTGRGFFTINAPGTRAIVGFRPDDWVPLGETALRVEDVDFAGVYLSSLDPTLSVEDAPRLLLTAVSRARNTGMEYSATADELLALGEAPVLMEGVTASVAFRNRRIKQVNILDHDGRPTGRALTPEAAADRIRLDGALHQAIYYELILE